MLSLVKVATIRVRHLFYNLVRLENPDPPPIGKTGNNTVAHPTNNANRSFPDGWQARRELVGLDCASPPDASHEALPRRQLPPGPYRSLGGCLDYSGWSERERFIELDRALQRQAQGEPNDEPCDIDNQACSDQACSYDPPVPVPDGGRLEWTIAGQLNVFVKSSDGWTTAPFRRL
jgi:hypothetical protein